MSEILHNPFFCFKSPIYYVKIYTFFDVVIMHNWQVFSYYIMLGNVLPNYKHNWHDGVAQSYKHFAEHIPC